MLSSLVTSNWFGPLVFAQEDLAVLVGKVSSVIPANSSGVSSGTPQAWSWQRLLGASDALVSCAVVEPLAPLLMIARNDQVTPSCQHGGVAPATNSSLVGEAIRHNSIQLRNLRKLIACLVVDCLSFCYCFFVVALHCFVFQCYHFAFSLLEIDVSRLVEYVLEL